jgi:hypothetical protein
MVKDIFPAGNSSMFVIKQKENSVAKSICKAATVIPEKFDGDYYLRDEEDTFRIISNIPAGLSLPKRAQDGKIEITKINKKIVITEQQFEELMSGKSISSVCPKLSLEEKRIIATGLTTEELNKLREAK